MKRPFASRRPVGPLFSQRDDMGAGDRNMKLAALLEESYQDEWETVANYVSAAKSLEGSGAGAVSAALERIAPEEEHHMHEFADMLNRIGTRAPMSVEMSTSEDIFNPDVNSFNTQDVIVGVIHAEQSAIELYKNAAKVARDAGHNSIARDIEHIIDEEKEHRKEFKKFRERYV